MFETAHVEITSRCNAQCPGCARVDEDDFTLQPILKENKLDWTLEDFKRIFPPHLVQDKKFQFGVVVDEPFMNPNLPDIVEYALHNGAEEVYIYTNGGAGTSLVWEQIADMSKRFYPKLFVGFSIDGHKETNHIYRRFVKWKNVERNINLYCSIARRDGKVNGRWVYLVFDHNEKDIKNAEAFAQTLGIDFMIRANTRNTDSWFVDDEKDSYEVKPTTNENFQHSQLEEKRKFDKKPKKNLSLEDIESIGCYHYHEKEIFVDWNQNVFPCCWWGSSYYYDGKDKKEKIFKPIEDKYGSNWCSLKDNSLEEILQGFYKEDLAKGWSTTSEFNHGEMCFKKCGDCGIRQKYEWFDSDGNSM